MAAAERITFADFQERFKTEEQCREYLFRQRFPNGFVCPSCGATEYYPIYRRNLCQCKKCRKQTSVTAGTVMHRTHLCLVLWFWAIYLCVPVVPNAGNRVRKCLVSAETNPQSHGTAGFELPAFRPDGDGRGLFRRQKTRQTGSWYSTEEGCHCVVQSFRERNPDVSSDAGGS